MSLPLLAALVLVGLALGYRYYGGFIARQYALDDRTPTPAVRREDGVDFVPTKKTYLLGQHFSAIAAAGPIVGPIAAAQQFGWLPALLWIALGVVFIGAVHDLSALIASVRHDARSIAEVIRQNLGPRAWLAMLAFIWLALVYVIVAFTDVTSQTFVSGDLAPELAGGVRYNPGGAVAMAAILYLGISIVMGLVDRFLRPPLWLQTLVFVPATLGAVWVGTRYSTIFVQPARVWVVAIMAYCLVASLTPVWALLQPRGYLGGFVLYIALGAGVVGIFLGGFDIAAPAWNGFSAPGATGLLFPFLFVTIACGACSGFHGLVCSGTTSKQIARETDCKPVGYGAMLLEGFVALIALATVMIVAQGGARNPAAIYGEGLGRFLTVIVGDEHLLLATTFGTMAFSTFVFDTLDVSTRLGRYILQELTGTSSTRSALLATAVTCAVPLGFLVAAGPNAYRVFWVLFGTSNQLLAGLSLLGISVWLKRAGRRYWFTLAPMIFVLAITLSALALQILAALRGTGVMVKVNGGICLVLAGLAVTLVAYGTRALLERDPVPASEPAPARAVGQ